MSGRHVSLWGALSQRPRKSHEFSSLQTLNTWKRPWTTWSDFAFKLTWAVGWARQPQEIPSRINYSVYGHNFWEILLLTWMRLYEHRWSRNTRTWVHFCYCHSFILASHSTVLGYAVVLPSGDPNLDFVGFVCLFVLLSYLLLQN